MMIVEQCYCNLRQVYWKLWTQHKNNFPNRLLIILLENIDSNTGIALPQQGPEIRKNMSEYGLPKYCCGPLWTSQGLISGYAAAYSGPIWKYEHFNPPPPPLFWFRRQLLQHVYIKHKARAHYARTTSSEVSFLGAIYGKRTADGPLHQFCWSCSSSLKL